MYVHVRDCAPACEYVRVSEPKREKDVEKERAFVFRRFRELFARMQVYIGYIYMREYLYLPRGAKCCVRFAEHACLS
jgi:hypothetical protein